MDKPMPKETLTADNIKADLRALCKDHGKKLAYVLLVLLPVTI